tara:strand:- start:3 stop:464 length:462 start_codon:yes stop_codon:yes gene_type:complete
MSNQKRVKRMIKEANKLADQHLSEETINWKAFAVGLAIAALLTLILASGKAEASCSYKTNALGHTQYSCSSGQNGTLRTDVLGTTRDSRTGTTWRTDVLGTTRSSDGTTYRTDVLGTTRGSDGTTWRTDALGTMRSNDGTTCKTDYLGTMRCN